MKPVGTFNKKELQKTNQKKFTAEEVIKGIGMKYILNGKAVIIFVTVRLIKKISLYKRSYFPEPHTISKNKIKAELNLSNYTTKSEILIKD